VRRIEGTGEVAALPDVAGSGSPHIEVSRKAAVSFFQREGESGRLPRNYNEMHVIRHEAIADQGEAVALAVDMKEVEIDLAIGIGFENSLAGVAALRHVERDIGSDGFGRCGL